MFGIWYADGNSLEIAVIGPGNQFPVTTAKRMALDGRAILMPASKTCRYTKITNGLNHQLLMNQPWQQRAHVLDDGEMFNIV